MPALQWTQYINNNSLLSKVEVAEWLGVTIATLDNWRREGIIPQPIRMGPRGEGPNKRRLRWRALDIKRFIRDRSSGETDRSSAEG